MGGRGGDRIRGEEAITPLIQERRDLIELKMPQPLSDEELVNLTPEKLLEYYGQAVISLSEMVDSLDHMVSPMGTNEVQGITFDVRAAVPGHPFWAERTADGRVW